MSDEIEKTLKHFEKIKNNRSVINGLWDELSHFFYPNIDMMGRYVDKKEMNQPKKRMSFDSTGEQTLRKFASRMQITLCNPEKQWFSLKPLNKDLENNPEIVAMNEQLIENCFYAINNPLANFYEQIRLALLSIGCYGIGGVIVEEDKKMPVKFKAINPSNYYYEENFQGVITCHYFEESIKGGDLVYLAQDGFNVEINESEKDRNFTLIHKIYLNPKENPAVFKFETAKWQSTFYIKELKKIIKQEFFNECPVAVGRWERVQNSIYPDSIARIVLPEIKILNRIEFDILMHNELSRRPPRALTAESNLQELDLSPDAVNVISTIDARSAISSLYDGSQFNLQAQEIKAQQKRLTIESAFYIDQFQSVNDANAGQYTATEANLRDQNSNRLLAPKVSHLQAEFISAIVERVASIVIKNDKQAYDALINAGKKPNLESINTKVAFESEISTAYRLSELSNMRAFVMDAGNIATTQANLTGQATSIDNVDFDSIIDEFAEIMNVKSKVIIPKEKVEELRQLRAEQQAQQQQMANAQQASEIVKNIPQEKA